MYETFISNAWGYHRKFEQPKKLKVSRGGGDTAIHGLDERDEEIPAKTWIEGLDMASTARGSPHTFCV